MAINLPDGLPLPIGLISNDEGFILMGINSSGRHYTYHNVKNVSGVSASFMISNGLGSLDISPEAAQTLPSTDVTPLVLKRNSDGEYEAVGLREAKDSTVTEVSIEFKKLSLRENIITLQNKAGDKIIFTPRNANIKKNELYSGVLYDIFIDDGSKAIFPSGLPRNKFALFQGLESNPTNNWELLSFSYYLVPYTTNASIYDSGVCNSVPVKWSIFQKISLFLRNSSIGSTMGSAKNCDLLTNESSNCIFLGSSCVKRELPKTSQPPNTSQGESAAQQKVYIFIAGGIIIFFIFLIFILILK